MPSPEPPDCLPPTAPLAPVSAAASAAGLEAEASPGQAAGEQWRMLLLRGSVVEIFSASAGGWLAARVVGVSPDRIKVEYPVAGERCDKVLLRSSPSLRRCTQREAASANGVAAGGAGANPDACRRSWVAPESGCESVAEETVAVASVLVPPGAEADGARVRPLAFTPDEWLRLADLEIGELLGAGGFGAVHRGRLRGEDVAIKKLHLEGAQLSPEQLAEFQKEVANLQALKHPRLIRFIGVALEPPELCIVTELASGGSLHALLHVSRAALTSAQRRRLALEIVEGVVYLHGRQPPRVHRDLKSANVVLDGELSVKLCDFGLTESMEKTHLSRREAEGGSPRYMAPEVFDARSRLSEKLDIWALGCLVLEILLSRVPHEECSTLQQIAGKLLIRSEPPYQSSWSVGFRPEIPQLVDPCFRRDPVQRPSALGLLEGLSQLECWVETSQLAGA